MKKRILFVMNSLTVGGAEKSLISLLETIDYDCYTVDLFLFKHEGLFLSNLPSQVNLLDEQPEYRYFDMDVQAAMKNCLRRYKPQLAFARLRAGFVFRSNRNRAQKEQRVWKFKKRVFDRLPQHYDVAIGYLELSPIYFIIDKVSASKKIGWIHTHYERAGMDATLDHPYFRKLDHIVSVSEECSKVLKQQFHEEKNRISTIQNIVSPRLIYRMAASPAPKLTSYLSPEKNESKKEFILMTVARLQREKGIDLAIEACKQLIDRSYRVRWFVLGGGSETMQAVTRAHIQQLGLENHFILLGETDNPYAYVRQADVYVQPSRYEGKSIALDEAKILGKPIVATRFQTVYSQLTHGVNGWITDMEPSALCEGIIRIIQDAALREHIKMNLMSEKLGSEEEIDKFYQLLS